MSTIGKTSKFIRSGIWPAIFVGLIAATGCQHSPEPEAVGYFSPCYTGAGGNAITIALPAHSNNHLEAVYIRRKGCQQWSQNLGIVLPGKSIHILNLDDGEMEVFWRERPHTFGVKPPFKEQPPTQDEWSTAAMGESGKRTVRLSDESHRRIVIS